MAEFHIDKQSAQNIYQGETLHIGPETTSTALAQLGALLARIDEQSAPADDWAELRAEVERARDSLPEREAAVGALARARDIATRLPVGSIATTIAMIISSLAG
ncbi:hypothetical protein OG729_02470 [Streptomyces sp. NBC_00210]|uniref:hypothetical protein n=1 Tax=unclassified Streptomyces TaxID=2593676 RepID=UPI0032519C64